MLRARLPLPPESFRSLTMNRRACIAALSLAAAALPAAAQLSCDRAQRAGKLVCEDASVRALVREVASDMQRLNCTAPEDLQELATVHQGWGREQFSCERLPDLRSCVLRSLRAELDYFNAMPTCEVRQHPLKFESVTAGYLLAHPEVYQGGEVVLLGALVPDACEPGMRTLTGGIADLANQQLRLPVQFKSLPAEQRNALCSQQRVWGWPGQVRVDQAGRPHLYVTTLLGAPLP
jgi:hypothetical protein